MVVVVLILLFFTLFSHLKKKLNKEGIFLANIMGLAIYVNGGIWLFLTTILVFLITTLATNFKTELKKKHGKRTTKNILANLGVPTILLLLGSPLLFMSGISASLSDTVSSEIGMVSKKTPRLITTLRRSHTGVNGAVSSLGFLAAFLASTLIATTTYFLFASFLFSGLVILSGMFGTVVDSILGATLENKKIINNAQVNTISTFVSAALVFALLRI